MDESMKLPEGKTCADCVHCYRCTLIFGAKYTDTECGFYPIRFKEKIVNHENKLLTNVRDNTKGG